MIWQNAWAWAGLVALGLPVLIHLFGRGHARVQPFPTLRFLQPSRMLPVRRTRVHDLVLLAVRMSILAAAVAALAQPLVLAVHRLGAIDSGLARAIVLDTSASIQRATSTGERGVDVARREAKRLAGDARTSVVLESAEPSGTIAGAIAWLSRQPGGGRGELVIISDFQLGAFDASDLARVPPPFGVRLARVEVSLATAPIQTRQRFGNVEGVAQITTTLDGTDVEWSSSAAAANATSEDRHAILVLADSTERSGADAAVEAARTVGVLLPVDTSRSIAVVFPSYERRANMLRRPTPWRSPWMTDVVARLQTDPMLVGAARAAPVSDAVDNITRAASGNGGIVVARTEAGRAAVIAAEGVVQGRDRLLLFSLADAGSLTSAALVGAATRARSAAPPLMELEPSSVSGSVLASWQRQPSANALARANANVDGQSDGRWFWIVALFLLAVETWIRRTPREARVAHNTAHDRAA